MHHKMHNTMAQTLQAPSQEHVTKEKESRRVRSDRTPVKWIGRKALLALAGWAGLVALTAFSWSADGLFFRELLTVTGILTLIGFVHLMALKNEPTRNSQ